MPPHRKEPINSNIEISFSANASSESSQRDPIPIPKDLSRWRRRGRSALPTHELFYLQTSAGGSHQAHPDVIMSTGRRQSISKSAATLLRGYIPRPPAKYATPADLRTSRIKYISRGIFTIPIPTELKNISMHIIETPRIGFPLTDRMGPLFRIALIPSGPR